jgi:SAM-dependent methyltransferase
VLPVSDDFLNIYGDHTRARSYADLEFPGTYHVAFRDLPNIIGAPVRDGAALDFGCGAGRSTRFLRELGFGSVIGVDISEAMLELARKRDRGGDYRRVPDGDLSSLQRGSFDLILCAFPFDNIAEREHKVGLFAELGELLRAGGRLVNIVSSRELYLNEWASFSCRDFPENRSAQPGDVVRLIMLDVDDRRPVEDILWPDPQYREVYDEAGLRLVETHRPLGLDSEPYEWVSETRVPPWIIYVLQRDQAAAAGVSAPAP